jgi:RNase H-fold protein (predicted Holliday junction resolvase)
MMIDWAAKMREQTRFAKRMAGEVPVALADPRLTSDEAEQLLQTVENCALSFDAVVKEMEYEDASAPHTRTAEAIAAVWLDLRRMATDRLRILRLPPRRHAIS